MADAQASGACGRKIVWVQVPSPALFFALRIKNWSGGPILIMFILRLRRKSCKRAGNVLCFERIKKNGGICLWHKKRKTKDEDASFSRK